MERCGANVNSAAILYTDDWRPYRPLKAEYRDHKVINHSAGSYVEGDIYTNTIEGFFSNLKTGMRGAYKKVSHRWLQSYLDEYARRYNARSEPLGMFEQLLRRAVEVVGQDGEEASFNLRVNSSASPHVSIGFLEVAKAIQMKTMGL